MNIGINGIQMVVLIIFALPPQNLSPPNLRPPKLPFGMCALLQILVGLPKPKKWTEVENL